MQLKLQDFQNLIAQMFDQEQKGLLHCSFENW